MKRIISSLVLVSIPLLMMMQVLQAYRYAVSSEEIGNLQALQEDRLEENRRLMAGIAVFDAPERVYGVANESLGLQVADADDVMQVVFPDEIEVMP